MSSIVISQPFYLPWMGLFEQMALCDVFVYYDDTQFSKGSFVNRVQVKTESGPTWMTVPVKKNFPCPILGVEIDYRNDWVAKHLKTLENNLKGLPHYKDAIALAEDFLSAKPQYLCSLNIDLLERVARYLELKCKFYRSSELGIEGSSTDKVTKLINHFDCDTYITGHGAKNYLDHEHMESNGIATYYIDYKNIEYPQNFGDFTPYLTILTAIASLGSATKQNLKGDLTHWKTFINKQRENK